MKKIYYKIFNLVAFSFLLPIIYGCGGGGGGESAFIGGFSGGGGSGIVGGGGGSIAALHNPEPITMALFGSGMMAMAFYKNRKK